MEHHLVTIADYITLLVRQDLKSDLKRQGAPNSDSDINDFVHQRMELLARRMYEMCKDPSWGKE